jgi:hypothetical protein
MQHPGSPSILRPWSEYLQLLASAGDLTQLLEDPADEQARAEIFRQLQMNLALGYFVYFGASVEHPDWMPFLNSVFMLQPNPDDVYLFAKVAGDGRYRVVVDRGSVHLLTLDIGRNMMGMAAQPAPPIGQYDLDELERAADGRFEILLCAQRPAGHVGNWLPLTPEAEFLLVRQRSYDWGAERDARLAIERLDVGTEKPRMAASQIGSLTEELLGGFTERLSRMWLTHMQQLRTRLAVNTFEFHAFGGGLTKQAYWQALFDFGPDEALILETDLPQRHRYWNVQLNDAHFNTIDYVDRQSSLNGHQAHIDGDGRFRAVIAHRDPGVPNWLDTAGFNRGTAIGRWYDCSSHPVPTLMRVPLADLHRHLPPTTPTVSAARRAATLSERRLGAQLRRRW